MLVCDPIKHPQVLTFCRSERCKLSLFISVSTYLFLSSHIVKFLRALDSSVVAVGGESRERVRPLVRNTDLGRLQRGLTLPTNATLLCRQRTDGGTCLRAAPGDLHDALITQMFDRHGSSDSVWIYRYLYMRCESLALFHWNFCLFFFAAPLTLFFF